MKIISLGMGQNIFDKESAVRQRMVEYGKVFDELHIVVFTPNDEKFERQKLSENVFLYPTQSKRRLFFIFDFLRIFKEIISKIGKSDTLISAQDPFELGFVGLLLKLKYKLPLQIQIHTDFTSRYFILHSPLNILRFLISHVVLSFADSVRVVSQRIANNVHIEPQYLSVLPIEVRSLKSASLKEKSIGKITFLTIARLEKEKDLETAIKAFKRVIDQNIDAQFIIVGDGKERKSLELKAKSLELGDRVKFVGWQNNLEEYYGEADIYISTSLYEGYGMSMVEAANARLALVISDAGVAGEIFRNGEEAFVLKPKDADGFAGVMISLSKNQELRKELGEKAKKAAQKLLISHEEYLQRYREAAEQAVVRHDKNQNIFRKNILFRYLVSGFTGAGTQIGSLYIFTDIFGIWYLYSSVFSFLIAIVVSFLLQKLWTFGDRQVAGTHNQFVKYLLVALMGILINTSLMYILVDIAGLWYIFAQIIAGGVIAVLNFLAYKFFVFKK